MTVWPGRNQAGGFIGATVTVTVPRVWSTAAAISRTDPAKVEPGNALEDTTADWPSARSARLVSSTSTRISISVLTNCSTPSGPGRLAHFGVDRGHDATKGRDDDGLLRLATGHDKGPLGFPYALPGDCDVLRSSADLQGPQTRPSWTPTLASAAATPPR